jgi:CHAT domain-containing protein
MVGGAIPEQQLHGVTRYVLVAITLVLSCPVLLWPAPWLQAGTASNRSGSKAAALPCTDCRAQAEQLRTTADALIKRATYQDLKKAVAQLQESSRLFEQGESARDAARNYLRIGEIQSVWSRHQLVLDMYAEALKRTTESDIDLRCSILSHQALAYLDSDLPRSLRLSNQAIDLCKLTANPLAQAEALEAFGEGSLAQDPEKALAAFQSAIQLFKDAKDIDGEARAWLGLGHTFVQDDSALAKASSAYQEALRLWTSANNSRGMAQARRALGLYWVTVGEYQKAMNEYNQAQLVFHAAGDQDSEAIVLIGRGGVSDEIGNYEDSLRYYQKARATFSKASDVRGEVAAIDGAAHAEWLRKRPDMARHYNEMKLDLAIRLNLPRYQASATAGIADFYAHQGNYNKAERFYHEALELFRLLKEANGEVDVLLRLGRLYSQKKQDEQALSCFRETLKIVQDNGRVSEVARAHFEIASIYHRQHRLEEAKDEIEAVLKVIESQRTKVSDFDDRASYFASVHEYYQLYIEILMQLDQRDPGKGFSEQALEAAEKSKVRSLLDMLGFMSSALTLRAIQEEIRGDDIVLLEYALGKEHSYLWVIDESSMTSYQVSSSTQQLSRLTASFRNSLLAPGIHLPETNAQTAVRKKQAGLRYQRELAKALLEPVLPFLNRKRVIIIPDGFLQYVPFVTLLPEHHRELVMLPSASTLKALRDAAQRRPPAAAEVAVFADPVFEVDDARVPQSSSSLPKANKPVDVIHVTRDVLGSDYIPRLPQSHDEARAIVDAYGPKNVFRREGFNANRKTAIEKLGQYRFIHFATHGFLDTHHPALSGLVLSMVDKNGKGQDGYLRLRDIYGLKLSADLVVLSACESGLGKDLESEGMIGLTRAFLYAGSSRVVSTLWKVDDQATAQLMEHFYQRLHKGESPSLALRGAQSDLAAKPDWNLPYYWAAFVLQGEYRWTNEKHAIKAIPPHD